MGVSQVVESAKRLPLIRVIGAVQKRYGEKGAGLFASAIAYHAFFSLFPLMLVAFAILGFVLDDEVVRRDVLRQIAETVPGLRDLLGESMDSIVATRATTGVIGILGFLWAGTAVVRAAGAALAQVFGIEVEGDNLIKQNLWALGALLTLGMLTAVSTGVTFLGSTQPLGIGVLVLAGGVLVDVGLFLVAYRVLTRGDGPSLRALLPGSIAASVAWTILKVLGSWYAQRTVAGATAVYGTFAGTVGILALLSLGARIFLYGAVLNHLRMQREEPVIAKAEPQRARGAA